MKEVVSSVTELREITSDLAKEVDSQAPLLQQVIDNTNTTQGNLEQGMVDLVGVNCYIIGVKVGIETQCKSNHCQRIGDRSDSRSNNRRTCWNRWRTFRSCNR